MRLKQFRISGHIQRTPLQFITRKAPQAAATLPACNRCRSVPCHPISEHKQRNSLHITKAHFSSSSSFLSIHSRTRMFNNMNNSNNSNNSKNNNTKLPSERFKSTLVRLNTLQSNAQTIEKWSKVKENKQEDLLEIMKEVLRAISRTPEQQPDLKWVAQIPVIHITGTKGKGSTASFTESILRNLPNVNLKTGLFTSPHLINIRERFKINGKSISEEKWSNTFDYLWDTLKHTYEEKDYPIYFRFLTMMALHLFFQEKVDVAIVEVGIGGRTDCTNVVSPIATGIASIGYDHMNLLGNTLSAIAFEKSGIYKPGVTPWSVEFQPEEALNVLKKRGKELTGLDLKIAHIEPLQKAQLKLGIEGEHQKVNAMLAVNLAREWIQRSKDHPKIGPKLQPLLAEMDQPIPASFVTGLTECRWPGRSQTVQYNKDITLFLDGAHTPESIEACCKWYLSKHGHQNSVMVFNCMTTRDPSAFFKTLDSTQAFSRVIFTSNELHTASLLQNKRAEMELKRVSEKQSWQETLREKWAFSQIPSEASSSIPATFQRIEQLQKEMGAPLQVLITGSLYLVGAVLEFLETNRQN